MSIASGTSIDVVILPGSVSRLAGGLFTSVRRLSESINDHGVARARVVGNRDVHSVEDLSQWRDQPVLLNASGRIALAGELFRWLQQNDPDLVHTQFIWSYGSVATLRWHRADPRRRHMISPRGMLDPWAIRHSRWKNKIAGMLFETKHLRTTACIHALCDSEAASIRSFGLTNPICVIPNGIDVPRDEELDRWKMAASQAMDGKGADGRRTMLFIGRIHQKKGLLNLIQAWHKARHQLTDWRLVIAGWDDRGHQQQFVNAVEEFGLQQSVTFAGSLYGDQKSLALAAADAFVLPSFSEGLPMAVLEAWAYGLPVLMTRHCNLPIGFETGSAVEIETSVDSLADGLVQTVNIQVEGLRDIGIKGRQLVKQRFQWDKIASEMSEVYQWVLGHRDAPECLNV